MAKEKCAPCPPTGAPDWMVTYGDLMTLLLCFFVLLFSFSEMDKLQFESMKDSFTGAFGVMDGHSVRQGRGVSQQTQKYTTVLFDTAVEKIRKASSDKFPHEQLEYLNSSISSAEVALGMLVKEAKVQGVAVNDLESILRTVKEKRKKKANETSTENKRQDSKEMFNALQIEPRADPSQKVKQIRMKDPSVSEIQAELDLDKTEKLKNLEKNVPEEQKLARGDQHLMKRGDASRNYKNMGRNNPLIGNPGEAQLQKDLTGQMLDHNERMDRVEGKNEKKRFDHPVPRKISSPLDQPNISGQVEATQSDANQAVLILPRILDANLLFYEKTDKIRPNSSVEISNFVKIFRENQGGYFQIEAHTNDTAPSSNYLGNRDLTSKMAIAFILEVLKIGTDLSPSRFAAVGWGSSVISKDNENIKDKKPKERIEIRWIKRGDDG
ncbi:MAG: flagellar motor protein MotB [bacterium]|nr:flagellar motor protein MotB [bacterium]